jgi:hypothetical protein
MRVCCISDLRGRLPDDVPECDLLLIPGDISADSREDNERFLRPAFPNWLEPQPAKEIVRIAGNHDLAAKPWPSMFRSLPWRYLDNQVLEVSSLKIAGNPWTPRFGFWAFRAEDEELARIWNQMPDETGAPPPLAASPGSGTAGLRARLGRRESPARNTVRARRPADRKLESGEGPP